MSTNSIALAAPRRASARYLAYVMSIGAIAGIAVTYGGWFGVAGVLVFPLLLRWPVEIALGGFALLLPFDSVSALGSEASGAALTRYVGALAAVVLLLVGLAERRFSVPPRAALWWSLFVLWGVATLGWAANPQVAWERLPTAISLLVFYLIATAFCINRKEMSMVLGITVLGGILAAAYSAFQFYSGTLYEQTTRSSLMMGNRDTDPNQFGASLLLPLSLAIGTAVQGRTKIVRFCGVVAAAVISLAIFLSMSRGAMVAAFTVIVVYIWRQGWNRRVVLALISVAALFLFMPHSFFSRMGLSDRGAGRLDIWIASMNLFPKYGLLGAGWNNFTVVYTNVAGHAPSFRGYGRASHNIYIGMLIEVGVIGLMFLLFAFRSQLRSARLYNAIPFEAACWAMLVMGVTLDIVWRKCFWFAWILLAMWVRLQAKNSEEGTMP